MSLKWWQKVVFYQIYPRSFADGNGDGIGDFIGITNKLDYLASLGIGGIWLSPHYPSPMHDCGYDISDYQAVAPEYGALEDFKVFLSEAHQRGIRVILDLVLNHTSNEHAWFKAACSSREDPHHDWYVWGEPNNWQSPFGGSAWEYVPSVDRYYYHYFLVEQPDLNWDNPAVKEAMFNAARFWLDLGVDGFRLDAIGTLFEHPDRPDNEVGMSFIEMGKKWQEARTEAERTEMVKIFEEMFKYQVNQPGVHAVMKELRAVLDEYDGDRMLVGEDDNLAYHGNGQDELQMVFNFPLMRTGCLTPTWIRQNQAERLAGLAAISPHAWPCNTLGNHDSSRVFSQFGDGEHNLELARLSLATVLTLKGTPFLYNGEEIGMADHLLTDIDQFQDKMAVWAYQAMISEAQLPVEQAMEHAAKMTRDKGRTPLHWENAPHAGFCPADVSPWLPVHKNFSAGVNVADQEADPNSLLNFYRNLISLRNNTPALVSGGYKPLQEEADDYLAFLREIPNQQVLVVLSFSADSVPAKLDELADRKTRLLFSSVGRGQPDSLKSLALHPFEILIAELI
jgi:alpha-glucosidase